MFSTDRNSKGAKNMQKTCGAVSQGQREEVDWQFLPDLFTTPLQPPNNPHRESCLYV